MSGRTKVGIGTKLGRYEILGRIAVGGMAEIHLARVTGIEGFQKIVVIKRMLAEFAEDEQYVRMFLDEARLAAFLHHQNIAQVYDIGSTEAGYFFAMEYVHGESVQKILAASRYARREVPLDQAIAIVLGVAAGLHHAHEKIGPDNRPLGIVHRDVSPANVIVSHDGGVKLLDFGVAKAEREAKTRVGTIKGKVSYMSPEQCRGSDVDRRSDVFSLGIVLYELTTGAKPFQCADDLTTLNAILTRDPPLPSAMRKDYPPTLEKIVMRALARDREERFASAEELQTALDELAGDLHLATSPLALAKFMEQLFGKKRGGWEANDPPMDGDYVSISLVIDADGVPTSHASGRRRRWSRVRAAIALGAAAVGMLLLLAVVKVALGHDPPPPTTAAPPTVEAAAVPIAPDAAPPPPPATPPAAAPPSRAATTTPHRAVGKLRPNTGATPHNGGHF